MAQTIHCEEHGLCIAQCELCADEKHEREIAELERKLAVARDVLKTFADDKSWHINAICDANGCQFEGQDIARKALEEIK